MFTKSSRNLRNFNINIMDWKTEVSMYTSACGEMCGILVFTARTSKSVLPSYCIL